MITLPIQKIISDEKNHIGGNHYCYSNGIYNVQFTHNPYPFGLRVFTEKIDDKYNDKYTKHWKIQSITPTSLKGLQERINKYLVKIGSTGDYYDVWDLREYKILYRLLKETGIGNSYDEDRIEITTKRGEKYNINLNCLMPYESILIDDNDNTISVTTLNYQSIVDLINYIKKKMEGC